MHLNPLHGQAGSTVDVNGHGFPPGGVQLRWDDPQTGALLKEVPGPSFATQITIPQNASPGTHHVFARSMSSPGLVAGQFQVDATPPGNRPSRPAASYQQPGGGASGGGGRTINGTSGADRLVGTRFDDVINCGAGNDRVRGGAGDDVINCGSGRDRVSGEGGNDRISGGRGNDRLSGGSGRDRLLGGRGNDRLRGGTGFDRLFGNQGRDLLFRDGSDRLSGGPGRDRTISVSRSSTAFGW